MGVESGAQAVLDAMDKGITIDAGARRGDAPARRRHPHRLLPAVRLSRRGLARDRDDTRSGARADARRYRNFRQLSAARDAFSRERPGAAGRKAELEPERRSGSAVSRACSRASSIGGCRARFTRNSGHATRCARCAGWWPRPHTTPRRGVVESPERSGRAAVVAGQHSAVTRASRSEQAKNRTAILEKTQAMTQTPASRSLHLLWTAARRYLKKVVRGARKR